MDGQVSGHAHDEVMKKLSIWDIIVLVVIVAVLFAAGYYLLKQLQRQCINYIRKEIKREIEASRAAGRP